MSGVQWLEERIPDLKRAQIGDLLAKRNYRQAKRQKEDARKTRQLLKQQRRSARAGAADANLMESPAPGALTDPEAVPK